jgi:hypothetical protein
MSMRWPQELFFLDALLRTYRFEYLMRCFLAVLAAQIGVNAIFNVVSALNPVAMLWRFVFSLAAGVIVLLLFARRQPGILDYSRRMDRELGSSERVQTYLELQLTDRKAARHPGEMDKHLLAEIIQYFKTRPPAVRFNWHAQRPMFILVAIGVFLLVSSILVSPIISRTVAEAQEIQQSREEALDALDELDELLSTDPLLQGLQEEIEFLRERLEMSLDPLEMELFMREALELLELQREDLEKMLAEKDHLQALLGEMTAEETAARMMEDPEFYQELLERMDSLLSNLPPGDVRDALQQAKSNLEGETSAAEAAESLFEGMKNFDPGSAVGVVREGAEQLRNHQSGAGSAAGEGSGSSSSGNPTGSEGSGTSGGSGESGGSGGEGSGSGEGEGTANGGSGQGEGSGQNGGSGEGGGIGGGAGTGSGSSQQHEYFFIPGEQEITLVGEGEEGHYTFQEIMRFNPGISSGDYTADYKRYYQQGVGSLQGTDIPAPLQGYVKDYFEAIAP